jgi:hypothetical protein
LFLPCLWAASAAPDHHPLPPDDVLPADRLAAGVLRHIDRRSRRIEATLDQLSRTSGRPRAEQVDGARHVSSELRRLRASLALIETYLLERRTELRRSRPL